MSNADWAIPLVVAQPGSELKARFATTALVKETRDYWCAAKDAEMPQALVFGVRGGAARPITRVALEPPRYDLGSCVNAFEVLAGESEDALTSLGEFTLENDAQRWHVFEVPETNASVVKLVVNSNHGGAYPAALNRFGVLCEAVEEEAAGAALDEAFKAWKAFEALDGPWKREKFAALAALEWPGYVASMKEAKEFVDPFPAGRILGELDSYRGKYVHIPGVYMGDRLEDREGYGYQYMEQDGIVIFRYLQALTDTKNAFLDAWKGGSPNRVKWDMIGRIVGHQAVLRRVGPEIEVIDCVMAEAEAIYAPGHLAVVTGPGDEGTRVLGEAQRLAEQGG